MNDGNLPKNVALWQKSASKNVISGRLILML